MNSKTLIIYLSLTGNTRKLARRIASKMENADLQELALKTKIPESHFFLILKLAFYSFFRIPFQTKVPPIQLENYDCIVFGGPVWMGRVAVPLMQLVKDIKCKGKKVGLFVTHNGEIGNVFEEFSSDLKLQKLSSQLAINGSEDMDGLRAQEKIRNFIATLDVQNI
jgi:flavodoxin